MSGSNLTGKWKGISLAERWKDPEWRSYITECIRTRNAKRKGKKHSTETKESIRTGVTNYWNSDISAHDVRRNGRMKGLGAGRSPNSGSFRPGIIPWNKGTAKLKPPKKTPADTKALRSQRLKEYYQSEAGKRRKEELAATASRHHKGTVKTKAHREAISRGVVKNYQEQGFRPKYWTKHGYHKSAKAGVVYYRSSYELAVYQRLDNDANTLTYSTESIAIPYEWNGITCNYLPDLLITYIDYEQLLVEIKPSYQLDDPQNQAKFLAAQAIYGDRFEVWSEEVIFQ